MNVLMYLTAQYPTELNVTSCYVYFVSIGNQKLSSIQQVTKGPNSHYAEMEVGTYSISKSHSKSTTEPQYEECGGGVTSSNVAMEENPAYQSVDVATAKL